MQKVKRNILKASFLIMAVMFFSFAGHAFAAERYWVGGTGTWDQADTTHWSDTDNGTAGFSVPTASDNVHINNNSGSGTITVATATAVMNDLDFTGYTGTFAGSQALTISGSITMGAGMINTYSGSITFNSTSGVKTITSNGVGVGGPGVVINFNGVGGTWQLTDTFNTNGTFSLSNGTLDTNNQTVSISAFQSSNSNVRTLSLGSSTMQVNGGGAVWNLTNSTNLTLNADTSTLIFNSNPVFNGGGLIYNNVSIPSVGLDGGITGANTFANLTLSNSAILNSNINFSANQNITGTLTVNGNTPVARILLDSNTIGTPRTLTAGTAVLSNVDFMDITGAGTASPFTGTSIGNSLGNTNITTDTPTTRYWVGNGGNWSSTAHWSASSGGASGASAPLPQDSVVFDANSITSSSQAIFTDMPRMGADINFTGVLNNPTLSFTSTANTVYGSLTFVSGMTLAGTQALTFSPRSSVTLTSAGQIFKGQIAINAPDGTVTLQDDFDDSGTLNNTFILTSGTFNSNNHNVKLYFFVSSNLNIRTLTMGNGTWTFVGDIATMIWDCAISTNMTLNADTSTIKFSELSGSANTKIFNGGGLTYNNIWFTNPTSGLSTGAWTITGSNTFSDFKDDNISAHTIQFANGTTQTVNTFTVSGSAGNLISLNSSVSGSAWNLSKSSGTVSSDYLSLKDSHASGGAHFCAGANSTNVSGNTGWSFTSAPCDPPVITTTTPLTTFTRTTASLLGNVTSVGSGTLSSKGFYWGTHNGSLSNTETTTSGLTTGSYSLPITGLTCNTAYDYQAYAISDVGTSTGSVQSFTTSPCAMSGNGDPGNPYIITNCAELQSMGADATALTKSYQIGSSDIDCSATNISTVTDPNYNPSLYNSGAGFVVAGSNITPFSGNFDGNNKKITNLFINRSGTNYVGLFGSVSSIVTISNVGVEAVNITGHNDVGGLLGQNNGGTISNSYSTGSVSGDSQVGGLVGASDAGTISNSYSTADINSTGTNGAFGGLVGRNQGILSLSYATGSINATYYVGGLTGVNLGTIVNSYAIGNVTGTNVSSNVGGLSGYNESGGIITNSYSVGSVVGVGVYVGGFMGQNNGGTVNYSFWDTTVTDPLPACGSTSCTGTQTMGASDSAMKNILTFTTGGPNWDFTNIWNIDGSTNSGYPFLLQLDSTPPSAATSLSWIESSPHNTVNVNASWAKSVSVDLANQKIQFYSDSSCTITSGSLIDLASSSTQTRAFTGTDGNTYTYKITSIDTTGNLTDSACSDPMVINITPVSPLSYTPATFIQTASATRSNSSTSISVSLPAPAIAGDTLILVLAANGNTNISTPTGFSVARNDSGNSPSQAIFYKIAVGGEQTFNLNGIFSTNPGAISANIYEYSGQWTFAGGNSSNSTNSTTNTGSSTTDAINNELIFGAITAGPATTNFTTTTSWPTFTKRSDIISTGSNGNNSTQNSKRAVFSAGDLLTNSALTSYSDSPLISRSGNYMGEIVRFHRNPPVVLSIIRVGSSPTRANSVDYTVTFSDDVTGVDASDFNLNTSGVSGASITFVSSDSGPTRTVTVDTGAGDGTIELDSVNDGSIIDSANQSLTNTFSGQVYTIDKSVPTVLSITRKTPMSQLTNNAHITWEVKFSESVTGITASNFATEQVSGNNSLLPNSPSVTGSGDTYDIRFNTIAGEDDEVKMDVINFSTVNDLASNVLAGGAPSGANETYIVDRIAPTLISATPSDLSINLVDSGSFTVTAVFNKTMDTGTTPNISFSPSVTTGIPPLLTFVSGNWTMTTLTNDTYTATYTLNTGHVLESSVSISVSGARDLAANIMSVTSGTSFTVDTIVPYILSAQWTDVHVNGFIDVGDTITLTFREAMNTTIIPDDSFFTLGSSHTFDIAHASLTPSWTNGTTLVITLGVTDVLSGDSVVANSGFLDLKDNPAVASPSPVLITDNIDPQVSSIVRVTDASMTNSATVHYTVTFSEIVTGVDTSDFFLNTSGVSLASVASVSGSGSVYTVIVNTGTGDGTIRLDISGLSNIVDAGSNPLSNIPFTSGEVYTIDKTPPLILIGAPSVSSTTLGPVTFSITYTGADTVNLTNSDITLNATDSAVGSVDVTNGNTSNPTVTISSISGDGTLSISIGPDTSSDAVGNSALSAGPSTTFIVDNTPPDTNITSHPTDPSNSSSASFSFTSSETNSTFECDIDGAGYSACTSPQLYSGLSDISHTFSVKATDALGNADLTPATFTWTIDTSLPPTPTATTYTFTGPTSGNTNVASSSFTITPNDFYTGTITITPSGGGLSAPIVLTFSSADPQIFSITPTSVGTITLTPTNSGSLTNPSILSYAVNSVSTGCIRNCGGGGGGGGSYTFVKPVDVVCPIGDKYSTTTGQLCTSFINVIKNITSVENTTNNIAVTNISKSCNAHAYVFSLYLKKGSTGVEVKQLQEVLNSCIGSSLKVDGIFGSKTEAETRQFQKDHSPLVIDGIVGPETRKVLNSL